MSEPVQFLREDGRWAEPDASGTSVTWATLTGKPSTVTAAELQAGTSTALRLVTPKLIHDEIKRQIAAIPA